MIDVHVLAENLGRVPGVKVLTQWAGKTVFLGINLLEDNIPAARPGLATKTNTLLKVYKMFRGPIQKHEARII